MAGNLHPLTSTSGGTGGAVTSALRVIVTTAPVSLGTALNEILPEYVAAVVAVIEPPTEFEFLYL
jgi:hypothetical protein